MIKNKKGLQAPPGADIESKSLSRKIFDITKILLILLLIIGAIIIVYNQFAAGRGATAVAHAGVAVERFGIPGLIKIFGQETYNAIAKPDVVYGFLSEIENSQGLDVGIRDVKFQQIGQPFFGEPVEIAGRFTAFSPLLDLDLIVDCELGNEIVQAEVSAIDALENTARIPKGVNEALSARCIFPKGITPKEETIIRGVQASASPLATERVLPAEAAETARILIRYTFYSKASHPTYLLDKNVVRKLRSKQPPVDIFAFFGVVEPQLRSDGTVTSRATPGPLNLGIGTHTSQPFVENTAHPFGVSLTNNFGEWRGQLKKLESLDVFVPDYFHLEGDSEYGETTVSCPFYFTGVVNEEGFRVYSLKEETLAKINKDCSEETLGSSSLTKKECIDILGTNRDMGFDCRFKYGEAFSRMSYDFIHAEAHYIYQTDEPVVVKARRPPALVS